MPTPHEAFNTLVYQTLEAAAALLEAGRPAEALHSIKHLAEMEITARQREQYGMLRREIESQLVTDSWVTLQLTHPEPLTFGMLTEGVIPYLKALHRLHEAAAMLQGKSPAWDPEIRQLSHHSPFSITLGFWHPEIIQTILEVIFDERRGAARRIKAGEAPGQPLLTRVNTTYRLLERVIPDASDVQKAALANQLLPDVDLLASSPVEGQVIGVSVPPGVPPEAPTWSAARSTPAPASPPPTTEPPPPSPSAPKPEPEALPPNDVGPSHAGKPPVHPEPPKPNIPPLRRRTTRPAPKPFAPPREDDDRDENV